MVVLEFIKSVIPSAWRTTPSGWISGNCPMCAARGHKPDKRKRGGIMFSDDKFQYNCFNCGYKTGWSPGRKINDRLKDLLVQFGADTAQIQRVNFELLKEQENADVAKQFIDKEKTDEYVHINWKEATLPPNSQRLDSVDTNSLSPENFEKFVAAVEYINSRNLNFHNDWYWTDYNETPYRNFANRIILPFRHQGNIVGFTARWVGEPPNKETPKYFLSSPKNFVYNLDAQTDKKYVIVTEGQLDALITGGIAVNGATPSYTQLSIIDQLGKEVIVLPDADKASMSMVRAALKRGWAVSFPEWENCKDAGDAVQKYGRLFTVRSILDSTETNSTKIQVLAKSYCR